MSQEFKMHKVITRKYEYVDKQLQVEVGNNLLVS